MFPLDLQFLSLSLMNSYINSNPWFLNTTDIVIAHLVGVIVKRGLTLPLLNKDSKLSKVHKIRFFSVIVSAHRNVD